MLLQEEQARMLVFAPDLSRLLQLARRCDTVFGGPHDIEWALAGDELYLLQRRGVTR